MKTIALFTEGVSGNHLTGAGTYIMIEHRAVEGLPGRDRSRGTEHLGHRGGEGVGPSVAAC